MKLFYYMNKQHIMSLNESVQSVVLNIPVQVAGGGIFTLIWWNFQSKQSCFLDREKLSQGSLLPQFWSPHYGSRIDRKYVSSAQPNFLQFHCCPVKLTVEALTPQQLIKHRHSNTWWNTDTPTPQETLTPKQLILTPQQLMKHWQLNSWYWHLNSWWNTDTPAAEEALTSQQLVKLWHLNSWYWHLNSWWNTDTPAAEEALTSQQLVKLWHLNSWYWYPNSWWNTDTPTADEALTSQHPRKYWHYNGWWNTGIPTADETLILQLLMKH